MKDLSIHHCNNKSISLEKNNKMRAHIVNKLEQKKIDNNISLNHTQKNDKYSHTHRHVRVRMSTSMCVRQRRKKSN